MFESFLFPFTMAAGGALISSPILIHLINRMRFKRIRWAAMEFLLKSQKRNRRRLIIEQIILLLLRILLVLLAGLLLARFIGFFFGPIQPKTSQHVILLDDTASMNDEWRVDGEAKSSFKEAKRLIHADIATNAAKASKSQVLKLFTLSQPENLIFDKPLADTTLRELATALTQVECSALHVDLMVGLKRARQLFENTPQDQRILYIVSDFRQTDWNGKPGDELAAELNALKALGVHVKFVDVADPPRKENEKDTRFHENLAIVGLQPEAKVTARNRQTEFTVTVMNYGLTERKNVFVKVRVNGVDRAESDVPIPVVRPGEKAEVKFNVLLDQLGVNQVSANIDPDESGLAIDNHRYAAIEVREKVPILVVDGDPGTSRQDGGDVYFLQIMFSASRGVAHGYDLVLGTVADLEKPNLDNYPSVYLVNVRDLNDKALTKLDNYVKEGGNVAFFMGDRINSEFYNKKLYVGGTGIFPVPLADRASPELAPEEKERRQLANLADPQFQIFLRNPTHQIFKDIYDYWNVFKFLSIERYFPVPRSRWTPVPGKTEELLTLPNRRTVDDYKDTTQELLAKLPLDEPKYEKYKARLTVHRDVIKDVLAGKPLNKLSDSIQAMLTDTGDEKNAALPNLREFWGLPQLDELRDKFEKLRDSAQYGDPLMVTGTYGKGRTVAFLTSIGRKWNSWAGDFPVSATFPVVMIELQKYLIGGGNTELTVGTTQDIYLDSNRYEPSMHRLYLPEAIDKNKPAAEQKTVEDQGKQPPVKTEQGRHHFQFTDARKPGVYVLEFTPRSADGAEPKPEPMGFAFNVDTAAESNLMRTDRDVLLKKVAGAHFYTLASDNWTELEQKQSDLSRFPWIYLVFLLVLVLEQALAVHLSFHLRGGNAAMPQQAIKPQATTA